MKKILTLLLLINCTCIFAQKGKVIALENETATDGLPFYLADAATKKPINNQRFYLIDDDRAYFKVWAAKNKVGLYSKEGKCLVTPIHKEIVALETSESRLKEEFFEVKDSPYTYVVDSKGLQIGKSYNYVESFCSGNKLLAVSCKENIKDNAYDLKYGFLNLETKKELFGCEFDSWEAVGDDYAEVVVNKKSGLINSKRWVITPEFKSIYSILDNLMFSCDINDSSYFPYLVSENRIMRDTCQYMETSNRLLFLTMHNKVIIYDMLLRTYLKDTFDEIYEIKWKQSLARKENICFLIEEDGQNIINLGKWESCSYISDNLLCVTQNGLSGMANKKGELLGRVAYTHIQRIFDKKVSCTFYRIDSLYGIINTSGKELTPPIYSRIYKPDYYFSGCYVAMQNAKYGLLNNKGKPIIPPIYDTITNFEEGFACVKSNNKFGLLNSKGKIVFPFEYDNSFIFTKKGKAYVTKDGKSYWINRKNKIVKG